MKQEISIKQKWAAVDVMLDRINDRKARGELACYSEIEEYVDKQFNTVVEDEVASIKESVDANC